jgi:hypothetical protein
MVMNAPLVRRSSFDVAGRFDPHLRGHEDWEMWIRLAMSGSAFHFLPVSNSNALVRVHANSAVQDKVPMLLSHLEVRRRLCLSLPTTRLKRINRFRMSIQYARLAKIELNNRQMKAAWRYGCSAMTHSKGDPRILIYLFVPEVFATRIAVWADRLRRRRQLDR